MSFEFFPPKTPGGHLTLGRTVAALEPLRPDFVSITYGAGGSDRHRTGDVVEWMRTETEWEPMPHLTCYGHSRDDVTALLDLYREIGIENILALAGDPRADGQPEASDYRYAIELLEDVVAAGCFAAAVAAHPQVHPRSPDRESDRRHLADKLRVADFAMTQFFFEVEEYSRLRDELSALGVDKPILPGIMPITNVSQVKRMADMSGAPLPGWLSRAARRHRRSGRGPQDRRRCGDDAVRRPPRRWRPRPPPLRAQPPGRGARDLWQPRSGIPLSDTGR